jgi:hypothetical protein
MDKSFNEDELSDIMKEIEALEEAYDVEEEVKTETSDVMEDLVNLDEDMAIPVSMKGEPTVLEFDKKSSSEGEKKVAPTSMMFKVQGELNLELQFEIGGKTIMLEVSEQGLNIQMEGGMTFNVPVSSAHTLKKAV